jgi:hypothetical protein
MPEVVPGPDPVPLSREHLRWILDNVRLRGCQRWNTVEGVVDHDPIDYFPRWIAGRPGPRTPGALVLADFIANHTRRGLNPKEKLVKVQSNLRKVCGLDARLIQFGKPALSHLAASGWPEDAVKAARCGELEPARPEDQEELAKWGMDQAEVWIQVLRGTQ